MDGGPDNPALFPMKVGDKLRDARLAQGMELSDIAARTRIPLRHLQAIETSDYSSLPSSTYAIGFVRAYARAIGADEVALARELRSETAGTFAARETYEAYNPEDPVREPSSAIVWGGAIVTAIIVALVIIWYGTDWFRSGETAPEARPVAAAPVAAPTPAATTVPANGGQVTLTATQPVWLRVYDADGKRLFEKEMAAGERYDVPRDAKGPMINVGRPESLQVSVNGSNVPPLGPAGRAIKDVPIGAEALMARGSPGAAATSTPSASRPAAAPPPSQLPSAFAGNSTTP
jgi:cytoskeleton protein RodZ